jgi:hypothetical protein
MMEAVRTSETSVDNYFTRQYIPENSSELREIIIFNQLLQMLFNGHLSFIDCKVTIHDQARQDQPSNFAVLLTLHGKIMTSHQPRLPASSGRNSET